MTLYQELQSLTLKVLSFISDGEEKFGSQKIIKNNISSEKGGAMKCYGEKGGPLLWRWCLSIRFYLES